MITLYHAPRSRSGRIIWLLEELGAPYEIVQVDIRRGDGSGAPDPANPHPHKQVPAIVEDGELVTESIAIILYLTDKYPGAKLAPLPGEPHRGEYLTWLAYYAGVLEPMAQMKFAGLLDGRPDLQAQYDRMTLRLTEAFAKSPYLVGDRFTAADLLYVSTLQWLRSLLPEDKATDAYIARCSGRPAQDRSVARDEFS